MKIRVVLLSIFMLGVFGVQCEEAPGPCPEGFARDNEGNCVQIVQNDDVTTEEEINGDLETRINNLESIVAEHEQKIESLSEQVSSMVSSWGVELWSEELDERGEATFNIDDPGFLVVVSEVIPRSSNDLSLEIRGVGESHEYAGVHSIVQGYTNVTMLYAFYAYDTGSYHAIVHGFSGEGYITVIQISKDL